MNQNEADYNRRDFLKGGSVATLMTMLGGVRLFSAEAAAPEEKKPAGPKIKIAVIGLGTWGREIVNTLALQDQADLAAICDTYPASLKRAGNALQGVTQTNDYKTILANKDIKAVVVATPTHLHKEIVLESLKAGKHVYCEAPLATSLSEAKEIALAAKGAGKCLFQAGLQWRSDPQRHFLVPFIRSGALGQWAMARGQYHKKQSWRSTSPNPEREKALNWRLSKETSIGLIGEIGCHQIDQASWFFGGLPQAVAGQGNIALHKDGRDVPDTIQACFTYPNGVFFHCDATLANSYDANYDVFYGSDSAVMLRDSDIWLFKEVDSPLFGWEVYTKKEIFHKETGIVIKAGASKSVPTEQAGQPKPYTETALAYALKTFLRNAVDYTAATEDYIASFGADDESGLVEQLAKVQKRPAAGYLEGYQATVAAIKANEAILAGQRVELKPDLFELS